MFKQIAAVMALILVTATVQADRLLDPMPSSMMAGDFSLVDLNGKEHQLKDLKGSFTLINFWAKDCTICRAEFATLNDLQAQLKESYDFKVVAIHAGGQAEEVEKVLETNPVEFTVLMDSNLALGSWGVPTLPTSYLIAPNGSFAYRAVGTRVWNSPAMVDFLSRVFDEYQNENAASQN